MFCHKLSKTIQSHCIVDCIVFGVCLVNLGNWEFLFIKIIYLLKNAIEIVFVKKNNKHKEADNLFKNYLKS